MKWKSDLFNNIVRMGIYLLLWGVSSDIVAQEDVKRIVRDSVRTSSEIQEGNSFSVSFLHEDFSVSDEKTLSFKSGKTKSDTYQKRKAIFGAKTKSDENNKGDT